MRTLDPRIRELHIARYGAEDTERYLAVIENVPVLPDDKRGENHHLLAASTWPECKNLKANPWNRLRVSHAVHAALTQLQGEFEARLNGAALLMKGQSVEAHLAACRRGGTKGGQIAGRKNIESGHWVRIRGLGASKGGKIGGKTAVESGQLASVAGMGGRVAVESGQLARLRTPEHQRKVAAASGRKAVESGRLTHIATFESRSKAGKRNIESGHISKLGRKYGPVNGRKAVESGFMPKLLCTRWNINRGKSCICGKH